MARIKVDQKIVGYDVATDTNAKASVAQPQQADIAHID